MNTMVRKLLARLARFGGPTSGEAADLNRQRMAAAVELARLLLARP